MEVFCEAKTAQTEYAKKKEAKESGEKEVDRSALENTASSIIAKRKIERKPQPNFWSIAKPSSPPRTKAKRKSLIFRGSNRYQQRKEKTSETDSLKTSSAKTTGTLSVAPRL